MTRDIVSGLNLNEDRLDFTFSVGAIARQVQAGQLNSGASFNDDIAAAVNNSFGAGGTIEAVLFNPQGGTYDPASTVFLVIDANNDGDYVAGQDILIEIQSIAGALTLDDFV